ncbi:S9 family peptidase [Rahnella victoriana]|uniref:S9 family peptidase n=1 Tax=Rahnella victoriana TaxID=1510570 RepID=UPI001E4FBEEC|nr:S9 family peptidase [Rahnella victoriana]UHM89000.1 S9 family peptidase [Rahnella victoriana]
MTLSRLMTLLTAGMLFTCATATAQPVPPVAEKHPHILQMAGDSRTDNYYWLRDDRRQDPKVLNYLRAENHYSAQVMSGWAALTDTLYQEMRARQGEQTESVPYELRGYRYQQRYLPGKEYAQYLRQPVSGNVVWQTLVDASQRAAGHTYYQFGGLEISTDNQQMAVAEDTQGRRQYSISLRNLTTGLWQNDVLQNTSGNMQWSADGQSLFYIRNHPQTLMPYQVFRHKTGTPVSQDALVYEEKDGGFYLGLSRTASDDYLMIVSSGSTSSEVRLIPAGEPLAAPQLFAARRPGVEYYLDHYRGQFYIRSNLHSPHFGLYETQSAGTPWQTLIAPNPQRDLENFALFRHQLVLQIRGQGRVQLEMIDWKSGQTRNVVFDEESYMAWLGSNPTPDTDKLRYGYSSMTTPTRIYEWDMSSGTRTLLQEKPVEGVNPANYASQRLMITARDGVQVPVSLVYRKSLFRKGHNPLLAYGYGAYGMSMDPAFGASRISLLDRGFVFALIHVRGGGELGQQWYQQGKLENKANTFNDFIDATHALTQQGFGQPGRLYAIGGSAGGLLIGAVINQEPALFHAVVAQVPFVDVLTTMSDPTLPLTEGEYQEWGNPAEPEAYQRIKAYSPYDNVHPAAYPNLLVTGGLFDSQVPYWEPAKWVARLRTVNQGPSLILLTTEMAAGHGGKSGRLNRLKNTAQEYSFIIQMDKNNNHKNNNNNRTPAL